MLGRSGGMLPRENFDKNGVIWCNVGVPKYVITSKQYTPKTFRNFYIRVIEPKIQVHCKCWLTLHIAKKEMDKRVYQAFVF